MNLIGVTVAPACEAPIVTAENPWRELRRRQHLVFRLAELPAGLRAVYWPRGNRAAIIIDRSLSRVERRAALVHELVHDERGGGAARTGMPACWSAVVARDETIVENEVAHRLVPPAELSDFCRRVTDLGETVEVVQVAAHFEVPVAVAERALRRIARV